MPKFCFLTPNQNLLIPYWKTRNQLWSSIQGTTAQILDWHYLHCFHYISHLDTEELRRTRLLLIIPEYRHGSWMVGVSPSSRRIASACFSHRRGDSGWPCIAERMTSSDGRSRVSSGDTGTAVLFGSVLRLSPTKRCWAVWLVRLWVFSLDHYLKTFVFLNTEFVPIRLEYRVHTIS